MCANRLLAGIANGAFTLPRWRRFRNDAETAWLVQSLNRSVADVEEVLK